jgi:hypothetical protein
MLHSGTNLYDYGKKKRKEKKRKEKKRKEKNNKNNQETKCAFEPHQARIMLLQGMRPGGETVAIRRLGVRINRATSHSPRGSFYPFIGKICVFPGSFCLVAVERVAHLGLKHLK